MAHGNPELKGALRDLMKQVHPDLSGSESERARRHRYASAGSAAYQRGDVDTLRRLLQEWHAEEEERRNDPRGFAGAERTRMQDEIERLRTRLGQETAARERAERRERRAAEQAAGRTAYARTPGEGAGAKRQGQGGGHASAPGAARAYGRRPSVGWDGGSGAHNYGAYQREYGTGGYDTGFGVGRAFRAVGDAIRSVLHVAGTLLRAVTVGLLLAGVIVGAFIVAYETTAAGPAIRTAVDAAENRVAARAEEQGGAGSGPSEEEDGRRRLAEEIRNGANR